MKNSVCIFAYSKFSRDAPKNFGYEKNEEKST